MDRTESEFIAEVIGCLGEAVQLFAAVSFEKVELLGSLAKARKRNAEQTDVSLCVTVGAEQSKENRVGIGIEVHGFLHGLRTGVGLKSCIPDGKSERTGRKTGFAETLTGFLREMAEEGFHFHDIVCVCAESVIVRNGFGLGVNEKFVGVAAAGLAVKRRAPLAEEFLQFFLFVGGELLNGFDSESTQGTLRDFANARNLTDGKRSEETRFHSGCDPDKAAGFRLVGGHFGNQTRGGEAAGAGQAGLPCNGAKKFVGGSEGRPVETLGAGKVEIGFID